MDIVNDKTFLEDGMNSKDILHQVQKIRDYMTMKKSTPFDEKMKQIKEENPFFCERYPMLFEMCLRDDFSYDNLNFFLNMRDNIINNRITSEDASKEVGKIWFDKYVDLSKSTKKDQT